MTKLPEKFFQPAEYVRQFFRVTPPAGTTLEQMLEPDYWAHVARRLTPHDIVEVVPEDGLFYAKLFVANAEKLWAKMEKIEYVQFTEKAPKDTPKSETLEPRFGGANVKWRVHNKKDNSLATPDSFQSRDEAEKWIEKYNAKVA